MEKNRIIRELVRILYKIGFRVFMLKLPIFDIYAERGKEKYVIKVLKNASSFDRENAEEMKRIAFILSSTPIIVSEVYKGKKLMFEKYYRYGIPVVSKFFFIFKERYPVLKTYSEPYVKIDIEKFREVLRDKSLKEISEELGVSRSTVIKYLRKGVVPLAIAKNLNESIMCREEEQIKIEIKYEYVNSEIENKLREFGVNFVRLTKLKPELMGNYYSRRFGITEEIDRNVLRISKAFKMIILDLSERYETENVIPISEERLLNMSKEEFKCLLLNQN